MHHFPLLTDSHVMVHVLLPRRNIWHFGTLFRVPSTFEMGYFSLFAPSLTMLKDVTCPRRCLGCTVKGCVNYFKYLFLLPFLTFLHLSGVVMREWESSISGERGFAEETLLALVHLQFFKPSISARCMSSPLSPIFYIHSPFWLWNMVLWWWVWFPTTLFSCFSSPLGGGYHP